MSSAIEFINVSKKFRKGEKHDSLRDLIPNLVKGFARRMTPDARRTTQHARRTTPDALRESEFWALKDVTFQLKKGEALGIIGPNGAGKSTILKMLSGIFRPTKGEIKINGKLSALLEVGAGFHPDLTGRENIYLSGAIIGMKKKEIDKKIDSIIEFSELGDFIDTPVKRYSSGMYVRLGFSISSHMDPDILLLDEVLAVGDMLFQKKCTEKITQILQRNATVIFISHNLEVVRRLCPKAIFLQHGKAIFNGSTEQAVDFYIKYNADKLINTNLDLGNMKKESRVKIVDVNLYDFEGKEKNEFRTGDYLRIEIKYLVADKINKPTFSVGLFSNGQVVVDHNSRFEGYNINSISGNGKINLIIEKLLLLPGFYELGAYLSDETALIIYDTLKRHFFIKEKDRTGEGVYYQPHLWKIDE